MKKVLTSGFYNPMHVGHINYLKSAKYLLDEDYVYHIAIVNGDKAAVDKHGFLFMTAQDRAIIVQSLWYVDEVVIWNHSHVADAIKKIKPDYFVNGGDRSDMSSMNPLEVEACEEVGCKMVLGVGGNFKENSSTNLLQNFLKQVGVYNYVDKKTFPKL